MSAGAPRVAIVTGASRGIGAAIARELSAAGCAVVCASRSLGALESLAASLPGPALAFAADLREADAAAPAAPNSPGRSSFGTSSANTRKK